MPDLSISEGAWLISVAGIPGTFQTKTGGQVEVEHTKDFDGGSLTPQIYQGKPNVTDLTVGRAFKAPRDETIRQQLSAILAAGQRFEPVITARPLNEQMVPTGQTQTFQGTLKSVNGQEANANSSQPARLELVFSISSVR